MNLRGSRSHTGGVEGGRGWDTNYVNIVLHVWNSQEKFKKYFKIFLLIGKKKEMSKSGESKEGAIWSKTII